MSGTEPALELKVTEPRHTPPLSLLLGFSAMLPIAAGALAAWLLHGPAAALAEDGAVVWAGAVLCFLAGVRRGLSFRTPGGPTIPQIATMLWLFLLGVAALASVSLRIAPPVLLLIGYLSLAVLDPLAARRGEAPLFFAKLRPVQMLIPITAIAAILVRDLVRTGG